MERTKPKPILHRLSTTELAPEDDDLPLTAEIKNDVLIRLQARYGYGALRALMNVTSFLDARYKTDFLETESNELNEVREELFKNAVFLEFSSIENEDKVVPLPAAKKAKLSLGALTSLKKKETVSSASSPRGCLSKEIENYLSNPVIDGDDEPFQWWKVNTKELLLLSQLARKYLAIQATSSPSERLFSKVGQISTPARAQLKPDKVDKLVFLAENL